MIIVKYFFKFIWWLWCLPGNLVILNAYTTVKAKDLNDIENIVQSERAMEKRHILAPLYSISLWALIITFFWAAGQR
jgi:uncharacterized membrane protein